MENEFDDVIIDNGFGGDEEPSDNTDGVEVVLEQVPETVSETVPELITEPVSETFTFVIDKIPGAPHIDSDIILDHIEEDTEDKKVEQDKGPKDEWDWAYHGLEKFIGWAQGVYKKVPRHSGKDISGLERAMSYLERLYGEVRKAMKTDFKGILNGDHIEIICSELEDALERLDRKIKEVESDKKKKRAESDSEFMKKEASIARKDIGVMATVSLKLLELARVCINGSVSAGHDIKDMFIRLSKKHKLDKNEQFELRSLLFWMGYPLTMVDRGYDVDEVIDYTSEDNFDLQQNTVGG